MASFGSALLFAAAAVVFWGKIGAAIAGRFLPAGLRWPMAPALGWAVHSVLALPLFMAIGMTRRTVFTAVLVPMLVALVALVSRRERSSSPAPAAVPRWAVCGAALLSIAIMAAILPKGSGIGIMLSDPIFDHAKVAMIDDIARLGVPAGNPFFGADGTPERQDGGLFDRQAVRTVGADARDQ